MPRTSAISCAKLLSQLPHLHIEAYQPAATRCYAGMRSRHEQECALSHRLLVWYIGAMVRHNESVRGTMDPCTPRPSSGPYVTPQLERTIAARWKQWVPWVRMHLLRARQSDLPSTRQSRAPNLVVYASVTQKLSLP